MTFLWSALWVLAAVMLGRAAVDTHSLLPLLLAVESGLVGLRLLDRCPVATEAGRMGRWLAWGSAGLPLLIQIRETPPLAGTILACGGVLLTLWALLSLGKSFGIAPADRGLVVGGPYRFLRHPMYAGALLNAAAVVAWNVSPWNLVVLAMVVTSAVLRIVLEERVISGYGGYAGHVRWRLMPGVW